MNVLAIGGHYDDIELGAGGSIARHIDEGDNVYMVVITDSGYTSADGVEIRSPETAEKEGRAAAKALGLRLNNLTCFGYKAKEVKYNANLIEKLDKIISDKKIDLVYTHWIGDVHQDHSAIGRATLNAARHTPRVLMYRSNWYKSIEAYDANFFVDITDYLDIKVASIRAHESECSRRGEKWVTFVKNQNRTRGIEIGVEYAEDFKLVKWLV